MYDADDLHREILRNFSMSQLCHSTADVLSCGNRDSSCDILTTSCLLYAC